MSKKENEKKLDELIARSINQGSPRFDADAWKKKYPQEYEILKSLSSRKPLILPTLQTIAFQNKLIKLAAAVIIIGLISIFIIYLGEKKQEPAQYISISKSPAEMLSAASLKIAYRRGGMEAVEEQYTNAYMMMPQRTSTVSVEGLLAELNGTQTERQKL